MKGDLKMKRKLLKKLTSLVLCLSIIICSGVVLAAPTVSASDPSVAPASDWNLVKVIDFERDAGFTLGDAANGAIVSVSTIKENADTPTGWYNDNTGALGTANKVSISGFPTLNQDAVSVKFKLWASDAWGDGTTNGECVRLLMGPAGIMLNNKKTTSNPGAFIISANTNGWGSKPFKDAAGNNITYKNGWNDIEIRLFKATSGADQNYTSAEYYFNGVQGTVSAVANGLNAPVGNMADTSAYPLSVSCGGNIASPYRFDEIYIYAKSTSSLTKLEHPTSVSLSPSGGVTFVGSENAESYDVKLYKDGTLVKKSVVLSTETPAVNFIDTVMALGAGDYCASVQANGDFQAYADSDAEYSANVTCAGAFRTYKLFDFERDNLEAGADNEITDGSLDVGDDLNFNKQLVATDTTTPYGTWSYVGADNDTPTGQYWENDGSTHKFFTYANFLPTINADAVSLKFKLWADADWSTAYVMLNFGPAGICIYPKTYTESGSTKAYTGKICGSTFAGGWGASIFTDASGNAIEYNEGWNDIEIRLFKAVPGEEQCYTSAEYYFNGVKATASAQTNGLNAGNGNVADTSEYKFGVRCGGSGKSKYRIDEICISDLSADTTTKLGNPQNVSLGGGATVNFDKAENTNYSVKLYDSNGILKATKTVLAADTASADFGTEIYNLGVGEYTFKVNAKGDYEATRNSDEVSVTGSDFVKYGPYLVSGFTAGANVENGEFTFGASTNVLRGTADGNAPYAFIVALYKEDGNLAGALPCTLDEAAISAVGESQTLSAAVAAQISGYSNTIETLPDFTAKIFSWENLDSCKPISEITLKTFTKQNLFDMLN